MRVFFVASMLLVLALAPSASAAPPCTGAEDRVGCAVYTASDAVGGFLDAVGRAWEDLRQQYLCYWAGDYEICLV